MRGRLLALALLGSAATLSVPLLTAVPAGAATPAVSRSCAAPTQARLMSCFALRRTAAAAAMSAMTVPAGYGPADLRSAYNLSAAGGTGATVAIVDAYDDPKAEADLGAYRAQYGLAPCTAANGCFRKVNQNGAASPLPAADAGWAGEISLDLDMVSAVCPNCKIMLVEANSAYGSDLYTAEDRAVALGARYVSNSWGGSEYSGQSTDDAHFNHPGVVITASTGDNGTGAAYPATSQYVTAVGGTSLSRASNTRGWTETAWSGAGSGCSAFDAKPAWQTSSTGCARRAEADVSAVADPNTGVAVYDSYSGYGWAVYGGTSASAPIVASVYALAGTPGAGDYPAAYPYAHQSSLFDVTGGTNGGCGPALCAAGTGWDGPTGLGSPNGTAAFAAGTGPTPTPTPTPSPAPVTVASPGALTGTVGTATSVALHATGGTGTYTWTATGVPAGLVLNGTTGVISGTPTVAAGYSVKVTATSGGSSGTATFTWTMARPPCAAGQLLGNAGLESGTAPWSATLGVVSSNAEAPQARSGTHYAWFDGYGVRHTDTLSQTVTIPAGCNTATLSFWLQISSQDLGTAAHDVLTVKAGSATLAVYSNLNRTGYVQKSVSLAGFLGQRVTITFTGTEDGSKATSFVVDDTALTVG